MGMVCKIVASIPAANGIIHVVDAVLLPARKTNCFLFKRAGVRPAHL
jgi:hypothetical protein